MMKTVLRTLGGVLVLLLGTAQVSFAGDKRPITQEELPAPAQHFIKNHFAKAAVSRITVDGQLFDREYKVLFADGREVEFSKDGEWKEVEAKRAEFPMGVLPQQIRRYLEQHYPNQAVSKIERDRRGYEVKLRNGMELDFDNRFQLLKVDD